MRLRENCIRTAFRRCLNRPIWLALFLSAGCGGDQYTPDPFLGDSIYTPNEADSLGATEVASSPVEDAIRGMEENDTSSALDVGAGELDVLDATPLPDTAPTDTTAPEDLTPIPDVGPVPVECGLYQLWCDDQCTNYTVDPKHCGGCDNQCEPGQVCSAGTCTENQCLGSLTPCASSCVNTSTNSAHCGGCDSVCPEGQLCSDSTCIDAQPYVTPTGCDDSYSLELDQNNTKICLGDTAQQTFKWAVCSCAEINLSGQVTTDSYNSLTAAYAPGGTTGDLATNADIYMANLLSVGGNLRVAGQYGLTSNNAVTIAQALFSQGQINLTVPSTVGTDGYVNGKITTSTTLDFGGTLTQPVGFPNSGMVSASAYMTEDVSVDPPCPCESSATIPVLDLITTYAISENNDNATIELAANTLMTPGGTKHLKLPCGVFYLDGISNTAAVTITTTGKTALFIGGGINISGSLKVHPLPGSELDLFVTGAISVNGETVIGSPNYPAATRMYVGGNEQMLFANSFELAGYLYSDEATLNVNNALDIFGGLSIYQLQTRNTLKVHYDSTAKELANYCMPSP